MFSILKSAVSDFFADDALTHGAAVAFYAAFSLSPILLLLVYLAGIIGPSQEQALVTQLEDVVGPQASQALQTVLQNSRASPSARSLAGTVTLAVIVLSATGVFAQLQYALNNLWNVKRDSAASVWGWLRKRLLSLGMIIALGFLLLTSLAASAVLSAVVSSLEGYLRGGGIWWRIADVSVSLSVFTLLFAFMYRFLPDVIIAWRDVWLGAGVTAALFVVGKWVISLYLARSSMSSSYGAAGSVIVLLAWVYYGSLVVFFGAELTQTWAKANGRPLKPDDNAVWRDSGGKETRRESGRPTGPPEKPTVRQR